MQGKEVEALEAWNRAGEPQAELVRVYGLRRTRYRSVQEHLAVPAHALLTPALLRRTERRLRSLPAFSAGRVSYLPTRPRVADVEIAVVERPVFLDPPLGLAATALRSLPAREVVLRLAGPSGAGELWSGSWRWAERRPRVGLELAVPGAFGLKGLWRVEGLWQSESYRVGESEPAPDASGEAIRQETRYRGGISFARWVGADVRWEGGAAADSWTERGRYVAVSTSLELRTAGDLMSVRLEGEGWKGLGVEETFAAVEFGLAGRSARLRNGWVAGAKGGVLLATPSAPRSIWPGAGTGSGRDVLLRAHPLLESGVIQGEVFGRIVAYGGVRGDAWWPIAPPLAFGLGVFVDAARAWKRSPATGPSELLIDAGVGLRLAGFGAAGELRIDAARGLTDGETALSLAWEGAWPAWR